MPKTSFYITNALTVYRAVAALLLLYFIVKGETNWFKWLLAVSFLTDLLDGFLARKYEAVTIAGSRLDSVADDLTILMAIVGVVVFKGDFFREQFFLVLVLAGLYFFQLTLALLRYRRLTSFHTYFAKAAMLTQGIFLVLLFFLPKPPITLFYVAAAFTIVDLLEEILLVFLLPRWETDVKGLFWLKRKPPTKRTSI